MVDVVFNVVAQALLIHFVIVAHVTFSSARLVIIVQLILRPEQTIGQGRFECFLALGTIPDNSTDGLLNPDPMVFDSDSRGGLIDSRVLLNVHLPRDFILLLRVGHHFFVFQHQFFIIPVTASDQLVMRCRTAQPALLRAISPSRVFGVLEIVSNLVEAILRDGILSLRAKISPVDDRINIVPRVGQESASPRNLANSFEPESIPNTTRRNVALVDQVEDGVRIAL